MKIVLGARGKEVRDIQSRLMRLNYNLGMTKADGVYGKLTEEAVKSFQKKAGLTPTGIVDDLTWQKLFEESLFLGERLLYLHFPYFQGRDVRDLQLKLVSLGFNPGPIDGVFGPKTERALKEFQQSAGLIVDGICGPETLAFLERFKGRQGKKEEIPVYPCREVTTPFPSDLKVNFFVDFSNLKNGSGKNFLLSLAKRLSRIFNAWGLPCSFLEDLKGGFGERDFLLVFTPLESTEEVSLRGLLLGYPSTGSFAMEGEKLVDLIAEKLKLRLPLVSTMIETSPLSDEKILPSNVMSISFSLACQGEFPDLISKSEEAQQRLAGAITEGIKEYFIWKQSNSS